MTAGTDFYLVFSEMTAALLEGSGWYKVNASMTLPNRWGFQRGCTFLSKLCIDNSTSPVNSLSNEFCTNLNMPGCTWDHRSIGHCWTINGTPDNKNWDYFGNNVIVSQAFMDNCPFMAAYSNGDCRFSQNIMSTPLYDQAATPTSRCFSGTFVKYGYKGYYKTGQYRNACFESHVIID